MVNTVSYTCKMANNSFPGHIKTAVTDSAGHCGTLRDTKSRNTHYQGSPNPDADSGES